MDDYSFDTWGREDLGFAPVFPDIPSAIPNTSGATVPGWLGALNGVSNAWCKITGKCTQTTNDGQPIAPPPPSEKSDIPWGLIAGAVVGGLLLIYVIKD